MSTTNQQKTAARISSCRLCGNHDLASILDLGNQFLTGVFPEPSTAMDVARGPLELVKCHGPESVCGLLQLAHTYPPEMMYGTTYGYRSGLNPLMVKHLVDLGADALSRVTLEEGDYAIDIGSNDGTLLNSFPNSLRLVGIDPSAGKFKDYYRPEVEIVTDFFSKASITRAIGDSKAKIITSVAMMYDLDDPIEFASDIASILHTDGIWIFEQSYMPSMITNNSFDTICHEHIEYYGLAQIVWMLSAAELKVVDVVLNSANGGSLRVYACHKSSNAHKVTNAVGALTAKEVDGKFETLEPFHRFGRQVRKTGDDIREFLVSTRESGQRVIGLGASTKGNVILQYVGASRELITEIGDVNPDKYGCVTPGSWIPIVPENTALNENADVYLVLPWHFRSHFTTNERYRGRNLCFPLPSLETERL